MPQLMQVVRLNDRLVVDLTSVDCRRLFVLRAPNEQKKIEVYETMTFKLQQTLNVAGLS
jgi:hypothetical protein